VVDVTGLEPPFPFRLRRLYVYFRGHLKGTLYAANGYACGRRKAARLAWKYARKGAGHSV
jgi:hypothetical protein